MNVLTNRQWIYRAVPEGRVDASNYSLEESPMDSVPATHECIVEIIYYSVDPYMRIAQARRNTWEAPHPLNTVQGGGTVGVVIASGSDKIAIGDWVSGYLGWQKYGRCHADALTKLNPEAAPVSTALGVLGMPGRTAWFGLMEAGRPRYFLSTVILYCLSYLIII
jgi:NADPH-dependent curcumin reductase CurA